MSQGGDGGIQPDGTLTLGDQKTQKHAKRRGAPFGCSPPVVASLQDKRSQPASIHAARLLSKPPEQLADVNAIAVESLIASIPLLLHPLTEGRQLSGIVNGRVDRRQSDDPGISQIVQEQARTTDYAQLILMGVVWTVALTQVAVESRKSLFVQLTHRYAVPMDPINEVFRPSKVYTNCIPGVPYLR
jgi:hypothetical protein